MQTIFTMQTIFISYNTYMDVCNLISPEASHLAKNASDRFQFIDVAHWPLSELVFIDIKFAGWAEFGGEKLGPVEQKC